MSDEQQHYKIHNIKLTEVQPGWSALAYRVEAGSEIYFLKVYDKTRYSSQVWIQGIDWYMPTAKTASAVGSVAYTSRAELALYTVP